MDGWRWNVLKVSTSTEIGLVNKVLKYQIHIRTKPFRLSESKFMSQPTKFSSVFEAYAYLAPGGGKVYEPLRQKLIATIISMGYDEHAWDESVGGFIN